MVSKNVAHDVQILPDNQDFYGAHFQSFERVVNTKTELAGVLRNLIKIFACNKKKNKKLKCT